MLQVVMHQQKMNAIMKTHRAVPYLQLVNSLRLSHGVFHLLHLTLPVLQEFLVLARLKMMRTSKSVITESWYENEQVTAGGNKSTRYPFFGKHTLLTSLVPHGKVNHAYHMYTTSDFSKVRETKCLSNDPRRYVVSSRHET